MTENKPEYSANVMRMFCYGIIVFFTLIILFVLFKFTEDFPIFTWDINDRTPEQVLNNWKDTSSILNSLLSPILLFFSVVLLWLTWRTSRTELSLTRNIIKEQLSNQRRKDDLDILSRQSLYLNEKMNEKLKVFDLFYNSSANVELFNFLDGLYKNSNPRLLEFYKSIGFDYEAQSSKNDFSNELYLKLYQIEQSQKELIIRGTHISVCYGLNFNKCKYLNKFIGLEAYKVQNIFFDVYSAIYMENLLINQYVKSTMLLLRKINNTESVYKKELIQEFMLIYDLEIAKRLIQFSDDIPDNFFE